MDAAVCLRPFAAAGLARTRTTTTSERPTRGASANYNAHASQKKIPSTHTPQRPSLSPWAPAHLLCPMRWTRKPSWHSQVWSFTPICTGSPSYLDWKSQRSDDHVLSVYCYLCNGLTPSARARCPLTTIFASLSPAERFASLKNEDGKVKRSALALPSGAGCDNIILLSDSYKVLPFCHAAAATTNTTTTTADLSRTIPPHDTHALT